MGVDTQLIADGTYFVVEVGDRSRAAAAGAGGRPCSAATTPPGAIRACSIPRPSRRACARCTHTRTTPVAASAAWCCRCAKPRRRAKGFARSSWSRPSPASHSTSRAATRWSNDRGADVARRDCPLRPHAQVDRAGGRSMKRTIPGGALALQAAVFFIGQTSVGSRQQKPSPPNVLLIQADDLGYGDLSAYGQARFAYAFTRSTRARGHPLHRVRRRQGPSAPRRGRR